MEKWIIEIVNSYGYLGILLLITIENIFPPIPSEVILTFGGFMTTYTNMTVGLVTLFATIGSLIGAIILYGLGRLLDIERWLDRWGHILRLKKTDVRKAENWFNKHGQITVFFCRFVPIIRSFISIPAGMTRMNFLMFLMLTTVGTYIWNVVLVNLGALLGSQWKKVVHYTDVYSTIIVAIIAITALLLIAGWLFKKYKSKA
jgi:membrane protein DedA with SNARE-associated domain